MGFCYSNSTHGFWNDVKLDNELELINKTGFFGSQGNHVVIPLCDIIGIGISM